MYCDLSNAHAQPLNRVKDVVPCLKLPLVLCVLTAKALARLCRCAGLPELSFVNFSCELGHLFYLSRCTTKAIRWPVCSVKTQISLGIRPVWSDSLLSSYRSSGSLATHEVHREDWSDCADAQADLILCWVHRSFCWFCHAVAHFVFGILEICPKNLNNSDSQNIGCNDLLIWKKVVLRYRNVSKRCGWNDNQWKSQSYHSFRSNLIWSYTVCPEMSVRILRIKTVKQLLNSQTKQVSHASIFEPPHDKTNKVTVHPAKTQINFGIRPVWSESSLCA